MSLSFPPPGAITGTVSEQDRLKNIRNVLDHLNNQRAKSLGSTEGGVSSFVGASSNDIQRMLNRGSVATGGIDDAQRQMEQVRRDEFLAKMRAQNPERFNNPPPTDGMHRDTFPMPSTPLPLAGGAPQFPGLDLTPSSSLVGQGIMGQAPDFMTQYMDMIRSPMQGYGGGGSQMSSAPMNPVGQIPMLPNQVPMQTYGSQNTASIQSPFA